MTYRHTLAVLLLCATAGSATAQTASTPAAPVPGATPPRTTSAPSDRFAAVQAAKVSMAQAIDAAEKTGGQGKAISAEFEQQSGNEAAHYEVKVVYPDGKLVEHEIDATSGAVTKSDNQPFERYFTRLKPADFQNAKASLKDAIETAERQVGNGAKAVEVDVEKDGAAVLYEIELVTASGKHDIKVGADGQISK